MELLQALVFTAVFVAAAWHTDRRPFVRRLWTRFAAKTDRWGPFARLRPERRLSVLGVAFIFASVAVLAAVSPGEGKPLTLPAGLCLLGASAGGFAALYGGALGLLSGLGLRR